ncbi:osmoprotectant uptake system permease, partial [Klebsiella michiganensis]
MTTRCCNRVALLLAFLLLLAMALPFINYAPNRLLSGEGRWLWQVWPWLAGVQGAAGLLIALLSWRPGRLPLLVIFLLADLLLPLLLWGAGSAAVQLAQSGSPLARTSPGSGLWLALALCLLIASDAVRRLTTRALWRWLLNAQVWLLPALLLGLGALDGLSLLKEYFNRREVFDDALSQHVTLLLGTLLPGLLIGLP